MSDIYIRLNNEDADITDADLISSGDVDTVNVHFTFSEEWDAFPVRTMCVHAITKEEENRIGTNFIGITSEGLSVVPQGALAKAGRLFIAVVGENPNKQVLTSTWVTLKIRQGADFLVPDDEVDVFGRLMPAGGNEGDILVKKSDENFDYTWKPSSESLEAGLNITILDNVISSNCFREVEELPEEGIAGVIYILDNTETPDVEGVFTWDATTEQYISFGKSYTAGDNIQISEQGVISATDTTYSAGDGIDITSGVVSTSASKVLNIAVADAESTTYNSDSLLENAIGVSYDDIKDVYNTKKLNKIVIHPYVDSTEVEDDNQRCSILDIEYYETTSEDTEEVITSENYEMIFNYITDDTNSLVNIYSLIISKNFVDTTFTNYTVSIELKPYTNDIYALRKYYGNENINLGNNNGVPANTYGSGSIWNEAIGTGNNITGQNNEVAGTNNVVSGNYNNVIGYGLNVSGTFNVAFGPTIPVNKPLTGMCNIVTAYGNDVQGDCNAVFGNNNKARGSSHLIAGHGHDVQGYNNLVTGEYSTVNGSDNAVFGINYGTIQGSSNLVNGYYTYVKPRGSGSGSTSEHNIIGGAYHTVSGSNNLVVGEQTSNDSFTFPDDEEATTFDHVNGYDNIYSGFMSSITGNHNILTALYGKILGEQNLVMGEHHAVKGSHNILTGSGGDGGFVGSNNIAVLGGYGSVINDVEYSNILSGYTIAENLRYAALNTFYSRFQNAQYINANGYGLKFSGTLNENDYYTNPIGLTIIGQWNEDGNDRNDYVFVVGGGTGDDINRKNVFTITTDGYVTCKVSDSDDKHKILGSACVVTALPQTGQQNTIYVVIEEEGTETTETTDDSINVLGLYIWYEGTQEYYQISTGGGGGGSYVAGNGIRISSNTISVDNVQVVNELPAQGTDNIFYQVPQYEQEFTLDGELPNKFKTQSAYDTWNVAGKAMMLCVDTEATEYASQFGIKYILFEGITLTPIATSSGGQDVYYKITQLGDSPVEYTYSTITNEWTASPITQVSVNDYYVAVGSATGITPRDRSIVISDSSGSINSDIGLEWMSGNDTSNNWSITYQPTQYESHTYTYADDAYEIYTGNPTQISVDVYLYKNGTYSKLTNDGGGGSYTSGNGIDITSNTISVDTTTIQEKLTAGNNITIASNTISADIIEPLVTFSLTPTGTTPAYSIACDTTYSEIVSRYQNKKLKVQMDITYNNGHAVVPMSRFTYLNGTAKLYFEYTDNDKLVVFEISKTGNPSLDTYEYTKTSYDLNLPQAEGGGF